MKRILDTLFLLSVAGVLGYPMGIVPGWGVFALSVLAVALLWVDRLNERDHEDAEASKLVLEWLRKAGKPVLANTLKVDLLDSGYEFTERRFYELMSKLESAGFVKEIWVSQHANPHLNPIVYYEIR